MNNEPNYDNDKIITLFNQFSLTITYKNNLILTMLINKLPNIVQTIKLLSL